MEYANAAENAASNKDPQHEPSAQVALESPFAGWTLEEATTLGSAGLLPSFPSPGEAVWGWWPDRSGGGRWLTAMVHQVAENGSGLIVVWLFSGEASMLSPEHVQGVPKLGEAAWGFWPDASGGGQWLGTIVQHVTSDGSGIGVAWHH